MAKSSSGRRPRVRTVSADDLDQALDRLVGLQGELAAVAALIRERKLKQLPLTGWGKYERAVDLLREFVAHAEFAIKTTRR